MKRSELHFVQNFDFKLDFKNSILIYDQILEKKYKNWIGKFDRRLLVKSGESLKELSRFPTLMKSLLELSQDISVRELTIVAMGGGSVGDFAGFTASILKRGVRLVHIPTTWLSAIDSAHGGKTALNVAHIKNQIGTFYAADEIYLVKEIFKNLPAERLNEARGEYYKIGLIQGGTLWRKMCKFTSLDAQVLWPLMPMMIEAKMKIVRKDPYEQRGVRHILNLGHTVGHVLESALKIPHGLAVLYGLRFAYDFGQKLNLTQNIPELEWMLPSANELKEKLLRIKNPKKLLMADKKSVGQNHLRFIFINKPGKVFSQSVAVSEILKEWKRQSK